jgi:hypothetical protein
MMRDIHAFFYCVKKHTLSLIMAINKAEITTYILSSLVIQKNKYTIFKGNKYDNNSLSYLFPFFIL